ncbi:MAG: DOMON-like domain-containing protein [Brevundimonas sp.]|nr:MAG: DOMON-like domain-containing protein [Brevundimonas sp.]
MAFDLLPHPDTLGSPLTAIRVRPHWSQGGRLTLSIFLEGDADKVRLPSRQEAGPADDLWMHTCLELFVKAGDGGYYEFNFSPSGRWAAYRFKGYRDGMAKVLPARITGFGYRAEPGLIGGHVELDLEGLVGIDLEAPLTVGVSAVIEDSDGRKTYWALAHPPGKPDFHHSSAFAGEIAKVIYW